MVPFKNGVEDGIAKSYADDGRLITITTYNEGYIRSEARINRIDKFGLKQGVWKVFFDNDKLKEETEYLDDKRNGFYRVYNSDGTLALSEKYKNGELVIDKKSTTKFEVKRNFYTGGKVKSIVNVINDKRQGVEKIYDEKGNVISGKLFEDDKPVAEGITDENGNRQGEWKFFYEDGTVYSIGKYKNGLPEGEWKWYFRNGEIRRDESFINGKEEGISKEYNDSLQLIATGKYVDGKKEGLWKYNNGEYVAEGEYADGLKFGTWHQTYKNGKTAFTGKYIDGLEDGEHVYYNDNGKLHEVRNYKQGQRNGLWKIYDDKGVLILTINYQADKITRIDRIRIN